MKKKKIKIGLPIHLKISVLGLLVATLSLFVGVGSASAADLNISAATTITIGAANYTVASSSGATSISIGASGITSLTVPSGSTFTITSADRYTLNNSLAISQQCSVSQNSLSVTGPVVGMTITPDTSIVCAYSNANNGGGGGGGGGPYLDTTAPTNTSVSINAGAATASSTSSTLTLAATDATQMLISNDAGFAGAVWETYATSKTWTLTSGDGVKTVYAKFRDASGNMSTAVSDTITLSGTGTVAEVTNTPTEGCSGGNQYNTATGALCVNNSGTGNSGTSSDSTGSTTPPQAISSGSGVKYNLGAKTLKNGSRGEAVKELQRFLNDKLNLGLTLDGILGPKTIKVIKQWQKDNGLVADGLIGAKTKAMMNAGTTPETPVSSITATGSYNLGTTTLKNGSRGEAVKELQRFLNDKLNLGLEIDGVLGPKTIIVIKQWQKDNGLVADGLIGAKTKAMMNAQ